MMKKYLRQLTQISIINFFFIIGLLFYIQKNTPLSTSLLRVSPPQVKLSTTIISPTPQPSNTNALSPTLPSKNNLFTELSTHNSKSDCWIGVGGHIYDVTMYFGSHPGGDGVILKYCGTDATTPFQSKDGIGADHSASAYDLLRHYLIQ